jgi:hypothetical protein
MLGSRSLAWFRAPSSPVELRHHALVRDADARLFAAVVRHTKQRLYDGPVVSSAGVQSASLRQGASPRLTGGLVLAGFAVFSVLLAGRALGRDHDPHARDGGAIGAAALAAVRQREPVLAIAAAGTLALGAFLACSPRKHLWLAAHPGSRPETIDLWMAGVATGDGAAFATEFEELVADVASLQASLAEAPAPGDTQQAS